MFGNGIPLLGALSLVLLSRIPAIAGQPMVLNPDGAWCWFQDERAAVYDGKVSAASMGRTGEALREGGYEGGGAMRG
jgi:hypothetical protein